MPDRSIIGTVLGIPPVAALGVAVAFTGLGVLIDVLRMGTVGVIFKIGFFLGCLLAVMWVRRRIVLLVGPPRSGRGMTETLLLVGAPLINSFPTMATTTAVVLAIGIGRLLLQRYDDPELRLRRVTAETTPVRAAQAARPAPAPSGRIKRDGRKPGQSVADRARERAREKRLEAERADATGETPAERPARPRDVSGRRDSGAARGEGRTSRSPRQS
ncbi:MAG: hypothetical protein ABS81_28890 [Pseudonocardia sp. SCN 72-86]|nr:MAG: hypothetical protein ABS81_28890 [Pseudonocardia sp. SCN 72-86]